jgi:hypothetical protein
MTTTLPVPQEEMVYGTGSSPAIPADAPPRIEARNISKRFGALKALTDVSMTLAPGSFRAWARTVRARARSSHASWEPTARTAVRCGWARTTLS